MRGWIAIHRKLIGWEWYNNSEMVHLLTHLVIRANHSDGSWQGNKIKRGQLITGRKVLSVETGISEQKIKTCLKRLKKSGEISVKSTSKYSFITICKYDVYQLENHGSNQQDNQQSTSNQPATNQQLTTNNNVNKNKNDIKEKEYDSEILIFYNEIIDFFPVNTQPKTKSQRNSWFETIEKLQKKENYSLPEIKKIVKHFRQDSFWSDKFLSLKKLRSLNKEGLMYIHVFAENMKNKPLNLKIDKNSMQNTLNNPERLKF